MLSSLTGAREIPGEMARQVGVSHAAPYRHFAEKDALLVAVAVEGFELLHDDLEAAAQNTPDHPL
jgi:AcrR family transcriptional regulator